MLAQAGYSVRAVDPSKEMIAEARKQQIAGLDLTFQVSTFQPDTLGEAIYAGIVCSSVIEYVEDAEQLLRCFRRALHPGGALVISYANRRSLWRRFSLFRYRTAAARQRRRHVWHQHEFERILERTGFRSLEGPVFFDSPLDAQRWTSPIARSSWIGTLGLVVAS
jgi:SAM-dependent methyltransferase